MDEITCGEMSDNLLSASHLTSPIYLFSGLSKKTLSRIQSMPNMETRTKQDVENLREQKIVQNQRMDSSQARLEVGSMVEVVSDSGVTVYGVIRWLGIPEEKKKEWAGIELVIDWNFTHKHGLSISATILTLHPFFSFNRTTRLMAALMGSTEAGDISPVKAIELCFFPSQSAALTAASSARQQRNTNSQKFLQVRHFHFFLQ